MNKYDCLIVANGSEAIIYKYSKQGKALEKIDAIANAMRRDQDQDLVTDRPGVMSAGGSNIHGKSALVAEESPTDKAKEDFAQTVADRLEHSRTHNNVNSLDIVASPEMLGLLREKMSSNLKKLVERTVSKDAIAHSEENLLKVLHSRH